MHVKSVLCKFTLPTSQVRYSIVSEVASYMVIGGMIRACCLFRPQHLKSSRAIPLTSGRCVKEAEASIYCQKKTNKSTASHRPQILIWHGIKAWVGKEELVEGALTDIWEVI